MNPVNNNWRDFCPKCKYYEETFGVCSKIHFNINSQKKSFNKKCDSEFYEPNDEKIAIIQNELKGKEAIELGKNKTEGDNIEREKEQKDLRGWLLIFVISTFIVFISAQIDLYNIYQHGSNNERSLSWLEVAISYVGIGAALLLIKQRIRRSVWVARTFLLLNLAWGLLVSMIAEDIISFPYMNFVDHYMDKQAIQIILYSIFWLIYLSTSSRVKAIYPCVKETNMQQENHTKIINETLKKGQRPTSVSVICVIGSIGQLLIIPWIFFWHISYNPFYSIYVVSSVFIGLACMVGLWMMKKWSIYVYIGLLVQNYFIYFILHIWSMIFRYIPKIQIRNSILLLLIPAIVIFFALKNVSKMK